MANRYWVGGAGAAWNATAGTKWATTSGGAGGAAVPTAADDVFFDANSTANATTSGALVCRSLNFTGYTKTFTMASGVTITIGDGTAGASNVALLGGSAMNLALMGSNAITFVSTSATQQTIDGGVSRSWPATTINGAGSSYVLSNNYNLSGSQAFTLTAGTFGLSSYTLSTASFQSTGTGTRTLNGNTGTVTNLMTVNINATNLTASLASSTWNVNAATSTNTTLDLGGLSYGPFAIIRYQVNNTNLDTTITGANTFKDLAITTLTFSGTESPSVIFPASTTTTITGALTFNVDPVVPLRILSSSAGTRATISANRIQNVLTNNTTFTDIAVRGETRVFGDSTCTNGGNNAEIRFGGIHRGRQSLLGCGI